MKKGALALAVVAALTATPVLATTLLWMDVGALTRNSSSIVMGTVTGQKVLSSQPGVPLSQVSVKVEECLKGALDGEIVVNNPGFPGAPVFSQGDEVILFISTKNGTHVLTGFQQGSFKVVTDERGRKVLDHPIPSKNKAVMTGPATVEALVSEINAAME